MTSKRHLVLYGLGALALLAFASVFLIVRKEKLSETPSDVQVVASTLIATSSRPTTVPATAPAEQKPFQFEIVTTQALMAKGLSGRADIPSNYGMLFVFDTKGVQNFWMKDMLTSIDILWINDSGVVVGIEEAVSPSTYPNTFTSPEPVRYVLETRAGEARRLGISVGTKLVLPLPYGQTVSE